MKFGESTKMIKNNEIIKQEFLFLEDPSQDEIKETIKNISNIEMIDEPVIFERFK